MIFRHDIEFDDGRRTTEMKEDRVRKLAIIPAYNEEENIINIVDEIRRQAPEFDFVVINDHSRDNTLALCREHFINVIDLPINLGIGGAVQTGYKYALMNGYDYAVQLDGDGQHDPVCLKAMLDTITAENADMVIGSRFIEKKGFQTSATRRFGIRFFTFLIKILTGRIITDPTSGYRMVNKDIIEKFASDYPRDYPEPESVVSVLKNGRKVIEIPVEMRERQGGVSSINIKRSMYYMIKVTIAMIMERIRR